MKKFWPLLLTFGLIASSVSVCAEVIKTDSEPDTGIIFYDDFEDYAGMESAEAKAAAKANWNYGVGGDILTEDGNTFLSNPYVYYQLPYAKITSKRMSYEYDVFVPSDLDAGKGVYSVVYSGDEAGSWQPAHYVWSVLKTDDGAIIYWGDADNYGAMPRPATDYTPASNNISTDEWHKVGVIFDYSAQTMDFYLDGKKVAEHIRNSVFNAPVSRTGFKYFGIIRAAADSVVKIDNVKFEKLAEYVDPTKPEKIGKYVANGTLPDNGVIAQDDFESYNNADWISGAASSIQGKGSIENVWHYTGGDIVSDGPNKSVQFRWGGNVVAYYMNDHITDGVIDSGKLKIEYKVMIKKMDLGSNTTSANPENGDKHFVYVSTWSSNTDKAFHTTVMYHPTNPYIVFPGKLNQYVANQESDEGAVKVPVEHGKWYTVTQIVDYVNGESGTSTYYLDGNEVSRYSFNGVNAYDIMSFRELVFDRAHILNGAQIPGATDEYYTGEDGKANRAVDICIDNVIVERIDAAAEKGSAPVILDRGTDFDPSQMEWFTGEDNYDVEFTAPSAYVGESARVIVAAYSKGKLQGITSEKITSMKKGKNTVSLIFGENFIGTDTLRVFVISEYSAMHPIVSSNIYSMK